MEQWGAVQIAHRKLTKNAVFHIGDNHLAKDSENGDVLIPETRVWADPEPWHGTLRLARAGAAVRPVGPGRAVTATPDAPGQAASRHRAGFEALLRTYPQNTVLPCQDQYFVGGQSYNCPYSTTTSESSVDVSTETWVSFWAAGLLDNREPQQAPQAQESSSDSNFPFPNSCSWEEAQLSSQLYRNKQLQDTLVQKEEELARLHEENNHLRQYLNSALVKCLEEKAKKLLSSDDFSKAYGKFRKGKRKPKEQRYFPSEIHHGKNAKRNLSSEFANCEEQSGPPVDPWVLRTLGLKDLNTIDDTLSANYSALSSHPQRITSTFPQFPEDAVDYENTPTEDLQIDYGGERTTPSHSNASPREDFHFLSQLPNPPGGLQTLPYYTSDVSPNKTEVAFSTSLSPHCNVKTHSFHQGQAFVRRDEEGGWKFTWVPKQS
ncbi:geminin coiled-coil domain-containing protein 1 [Molossus molossus]|uniref:geminin coiled-coil domain-containing protein 1 n=1 Tax=Molossus molossus TaxID=27622 RepID=UPI00174698EF|nr:geminin coiled-coil domain-containing protein 1 [Molossus molossus]